MSEQINSSNTIMQNRELLSIKKYNSKYQEALIKSKKVIQNKTLATPPIESTVNTSPKKLIKLKNEIDNGKLHKACLLCLFVFLGVGFSGSFPNTGRYQLLLE